VLGVAWCRKQAKDALIDERTRIIRRIVLSRVRDGRPVGVVSFTFERAGIQPDSTYPPWGHLDDDAPIVGPDQPLRRRRDLARFFDSLVVETD
jgi:hypothetical protein